MLSRILFACFLALTLLLGSCSRDPETRKKKFLANGNKYFESGKFREASIMFRNALKEDARYGDAYYRLALTSLKLGQYPDAINALRRSVELQPDNLDAARQLSDLYISISGLASYVVANRYTLSTVLDIDLTSAPRMKRRLDHVPEMVLSYLCNIEKPAKRKPSPRSRA